MQLEPYLATFKQVGKEMAAIGEMIARNAQAAESQARETSELAGLVVGTGTVVACIVLLLVSWAISRDIVARLRQAVEVAQTVSTGDLTSRIEVRGTDEAAQLLEALARMNGSLVQLVGTVRQSSENIASGSVQIANGNQT
ncbi:methyl-accepting chemotaxis protein [Ramlibacter terrae]|uniref:Methyl-accepting chemotaxis protein n=1 Tax=Ramlibacter terrae TaxID=2732511 RepID=A0ABX6P2R8_9BURK|nr:methyl-accepting chemotaxis protein [Ramlibacter terrae]